MRKLWIVTHLLLCSLAAPAQIPRAATPTFGLAAGPYFLAQSVQLACTTPFPKIYYTTDSSTPAYGSTLYKTAIVTASSGRQTIKAICSASGYRDSTVAVAAFWINPPDQPALASENFTSYYSTSASNNFQIKLDRYGTQGKWIVNGDESSSSATVQLATGSLGDHTVEGVGGGGSNWLITNMSAVFPANQWAKVTTPGYLGDGSAGPCVMCDTGGSVTGYGLTTKYTGQFTMSRYNNSSQQVLAQAVIDTNPGDVLELRIIGNVLIPLLNGAAPPGMMPDGGATVVTVGGLIGYVDPAPLTSGNPGVVTNGKAFYNWSAGVIGTSTAATVNVQEANTYSSYSLFGSTAGTTSFRWR